MIEISEEMDAYLIAVRGIPLSVPYYGGVLIRHLF